ncbi:type II secretion system protein [Candidatus Gottesmanbacteria bacterium]|nr:type II secretion system protein [Candidatus Gottesmanbacteria bacterium]
MNYELRIKNRELKKGFTLLELLVVIAIIAVLISMATVSYSSAQKKARDSKRKQDVKAVQAALEQYYADNNGNYIAGCNPGTTYLPSGMPTDPKTGSAYTATAFGASCATTATYCLCAALEGETNTTTGCDGTSPPSGYVGTFCVRNLQ